MPNKILIVGSDKIENGIQKRKLGRLLLESLKENNIQWDIYFPTVVQPLNLQAYDGVFIWSHIVYRDLQYRAGAHDIEQQARKAGIPIINSIINAEAPHSFFLERWREVGIHCARVQRFEKFEDIHLNYPLILRRDGVHKGLDVFLVNDANEAKTLIQARQQGSALNNLDTAIEFYDAQCEDGYYRKYRSYVIGQRIIHRHLQVADSWLVNFDHSISNLAIRDEHRSFMETGNQNDDIILNAAAATGHEIVALDYSIDKEGNHIFWECNRHFLMGGDTARDEIIPLLKQLSRVVDAHLIDAIDKVFLSLEEDKRWVLNGKQKTSLYQSINQLIADLDKLNLMDTKICQTLCDLEEERQLEGSIKKLLCDLIKKKIQNKGICH